VCVSKTNGASTFRIITGTIYGSGTTVTAALRNIAASGSGSALYNESTAQRGRLNGTTWTSSGNLTTTNNTINVLNGANQ
jgi:hypothetical protein